MSTETKEKVTRESLITKDRSIFALSTFLASLAYAGNIPIVRMAFADMSKKVSAAIKEEYLAEFTNWLSGDNLGDNIENIKNSIKQTLEPVLQTWVNLPEEDFTPQRGRNLATESLELFGMTATTLEHVQKMLKGCKLYDFVINGLPEGITQSDITSLHRVCTASCSSIRDIIPDELKPKRETKKQVSTNQAQPVTNEDEPENEPSSNEDLSYATVE